MDVDLNAIIESLLNREKEYVRQDREEYGCAMVVIVSPDGIDLDFPKFEDQETKEAAYKRVVDLAKVKMATAILTFNNACGRSAQYPGELDEIGPLELDASNARPCILITISGPGIQSRAMEMCYVIHSEDVMFSDMKTLDSAQVNLLSEWPCDEPSLPS